MDITHRDLRYNDVIMPDRDGLRERFISAKCNSSDELAIFDGFRLPSGNIAAQMVFGGCGFEQAARARMGGAEWPLLWLQGDVSSETHISGTQAFVIEGQSPRHIALSGQLVGSVWSDADADFCLLAGVLPANSAESRGSQAISCFQQIEAALHKAGMDFSHVVRTWFFLDDLLAWYDEFNAARTEFFQGRGVFDRLIPASTGIGARNPAGMALAAGTLAIRPRHGRVHIAEVVSPLQCPATEYRSSFSRAVEVAFPDRRMLIVSGTASIAADGKSMFTNDVAKQIHLTLDVVEAILRSREMNWKNTVRAVGYFRDMDALPVFEACCCERGIPPLPVVPAHATVCRDDLLFEIELDAISTVGLEKEKGVAGDVAYGN